MGTKSPWEHFTLEELRCSHCGETKMDNEFMKKLVLIRKLCGFPLRITSGYRCPDHPIEKAKGHHRGPHATGKAVDIAISGENAITFLKHALEHGMTGIGVNQRSAQVRFIHVDQLAPRIWSY